MRVLMNVQNSHSLSTRRCEGCLHIPTFCSLLAPCSLLESGWVSRLRPRLESSSCFNDTRTSFLRENFSTCSSCANFRSTSPNTAEVVDDENCSVFRWRRVATTARAARHVRRRKKEEIICESQWNLLAVVGWAVARLDCPIQCSKYSEYVHSSTKTSKHHFDFRIPYRYRPVQLTCK